MVDLDFCSPKYIPPEISRFKDINQRGKGKACNTGVLTLTLERHPDTHKTVIKDLYSHVPLLAQRALYSEDSNPSMAYIYIISPSGGILQGDRYRIDINAKEASQAHITTQGATRIYHMEKNYASQMINITVDDGAYLEFIPDQIIPYRGSRFYQTFKAQVHTRGTLVYSEIITSGRAASAEAFQYDALYLNNEVSDHEGKLRFTETAILEPKKGLQKMGILGDYSVVGSLYLATKSEDSKELILEFNAFLQKSSSLKASVTMLPNDLGILTRILGKESKDVQACIFEIVRLVRKKAIGSSFSRVRKY